MQLKWMARMSRFTKVYWGEDRHTAVSFEPFERKPAHLEVTACMAFSLDEKGRLLLVRSKRGWGLPGGHLELGESPEDCIRRELAEEASVALGDLNLVGGWVTKKQIQTKDNSKYPDNGVMLLFLSTVSRIDQFAQDFETLERDFVRLEDISMVHDGRSDFYAIVEYIKEKYLP